MKKVNISKFNKD